MVELTAASGVQVQNLHYSVSGRVLFQGFSAQFPPGVSLLCGDEGTGKTSLLRLLAGDLTAVSGSVSVAPDDDVFWVDLQGAEHDQATVQACWDALSPRYPRWNEALLQDLQATKRIEPQADGNWRLLPVPGVLSSPTVPPIRSTSRRTMDRPRPVPP